MAESLSHNNSKECGEVKEITAKKPAVFSKIDLFPHRTRAKKLKKELEEFRELQEIAFKLGDSVAYKAIDSQVKDIYVQYLVLLFIEGLYFIVPHLFIMGLLAMVAREITIFGFIIPITIYYPIAAFAVIFFWRKAKKRRVIQQQNNNNDVKKDK